MTTGCGFIGLGLMGRRMAARLLDPGGGPVAVHSRTRIDLADGLAWRDTPREVGAAADQVFLMVPDAAATRAVLDGPDGLLGSLAPGTIVINTATIGPEAAAEIGHRVLETGAGYLDAPVLGSTRAAEQGQLVFLVGGAEATLDRARPALGRLGRRILHLGAIGRGNAAKLLFNVQLGVAMASLADTLRLAAALGLPAGFVLDEILSSPVTAPALAAKRAMFASDAFEPQFPLDWMIKDLELAEAGAAWAGASLPVVAAALGRYREALAAGDGKRDFAVVGRI